MQVVVVKFALQYKRECSLKRVEQLSISNGLVRDSFIRSEGVFVTEYEEVLQDWYADSVQRSQRLLHTSDIANPLTGTMNLPQWKTINQFCGSGGEHYAFVGDQP